METRVSPLLCRLSVAAVLNEIYHVVIIDFIQLDPIVNANNSIQNHQFK